MFDNKIVPLIKFKNILLHIASINDLSLKL